MTAVSRQNEAARALHPAKPQTLRWAERNFLFEIRSADRQVLEMAAGIFSANTDPHADAGDQPAARSWTIESLSGSETRWTVSGFSESSSMIPAESDCRETALLHVEYDSLDWLLNNSRDAVVVHAALLSKHAKGIVIVGPSFAGKSTLATALWREGWTLMSDDLVFITPDSCSASPAPRRVSLRFESRSLVGDDLWNEIAVTPSCIETSKGLFFHPHELSRVEKEKATPLSAIFFLARRESVARPAELCPMNSAKAALSLLPYAFNVRTLPFVEGLRRISPVLETTPAFDLGRSDLRSMTNAVESAIG
jgi:hypothetical protein